MRICIELTSNPLNIKIQLKERWYFFPIPYFRWVDRNFNQWWNEQNRSLDRVNYGINLRQANATGNNDKLTVGYITGYTHQAIVRYQMPFIDKQLKYGMGLGWAQFNQKEVNYATMGNKQVFFRTENIIREGYRGNANLTYRPNLFERHALQVGFGKESISDTAFAIAPNFLPNHKKFESNKNGLWKYFKKKIIALKCYRDEIKSYPFPRSIQGVEIQAKYRGLQSGLEYSEAFKMERKII